MKWHTNEPPINIPVLCKFAKEIDYDLNFYVCYKKQADIYDNGKWIDGFEMVEAAGEEYGAWSMNKLIAWTTLEELEKDFQDFN